MAFNDGGYDDTESDDDDGGYDNTQSVQVNSMFLTDIYSSKLGSLPKPEQTLEVIPQHIYCHQDCPPQLLCIIMHYYALFVFNRFFIDPTEEVGTRHLQKILCL